MEQQQRVILAFALALVALLLYQELVVRRYRPVPVAPPAAPAEPAARATEARPAGEVQNAARELGGPVDDSSLVTVETDVYRAAFHPVGGRLARLELTQFRRTVSADSPPVDLVQSGAVLPLTVTFPSGQSDARVRYDTTVPGPIHGTERGEIVFRGTDPQGEPLEKRIGFQADRYALDVTVHTSQKPGAAVGLVVTPIPTETARGWGWGDERAVTLANRRISESPLEELEKKPTSVEAATWAGFAGQYFLTAVIPRSGTGRVLLGSVDATPIVRVDEPLAAGRAQYTVFAGPKERERLAAVGHELDRALDFGWFWFIAVPLLYALRVLSNVTGNYGVAIIVLTALVKLVTAPLTQTTFKNMRAMQKLQPEMLRLRERFKDNQTELQKEMMELYRRHRVNPFSGCVPMLLQLPIFVGLYNTLSHSIELRHAPFMLWIDDLSAPDRLTLWGIGIPVLTLIMGGTMLLQQWMTPQQGDPMQQRMMMFMPVIFTFMFINFPSGLVLYWLVNNVLTIGQQALMMRGST